MENLVIEIPTDFIDPISGQMLYDPVVCDDSQIMNRVTALMEGKNNIKETVNVRKIISGWARDNNLMLNQYYWTCFEDTKDALRTLCKFHRDSKKSGHFRPETYPHLAATIWLKNNSQIILSVLIHSSEDEDLMVSHQPIVIDTTTQQIKFLIWAVDGVMRCERISQIKTIFIKHHPECLWIEPWK